MLDNRLMAIAKLAKGANSLIDIGTDHGYLPIYLIKHNWINTAIAADVSKGSLSKAIDEVAIQKLTSKIETRLGSGLEVLKEEDNIDIAVFAGMGGVLISKLIDKKLDYVSRHNLKLIMQPVQLPEDLREYLYENNFVITHEELSKAEARVYHIIVAKHSNEKQNTKTYTNQIQKDIYLELGEGNLNSKDKYQLKLLKQIIEFKLLDIDKVNKHLSTQNTQNSLERLEYLKLKETMLNEILENLEV